MASDNDMIDIKNVSEKECSVVYGIIDENGDPKGLRAILGPGLIDSFPKTVAKLFLTNHPTRIRVHTPVTNPFNSSGDHVWIANGTGNPFAPLTVKLRGYTPEGKPTVFEEPNPISTPTVIRRKIKRDDTVEITKSGEEELVCNLPFRWEIFPFTRTRIPTKIVEWFERRDSNALKHQQGKLIRCRAPSDFEPQRDWSIEDLACWLEIVAPKHLDLKLFDGDLLQVGLAKKDLGKIRDVKNQLWPKIFHILIDDSFGIPTEEFFNAKKKEILKRMSKK